MQIVRVMNVYHVQIRRSSLILSIALMILSVVSVVVASFGAAMNLAVTEIKRNRVEVNNAIQYTNSVRSEIVQACGNKLSAIR